MYNNLNWNLRELGWKGFIVKLYRHHNRDAGALILRLAIGILLFAAGWWKITNVDMTVGFFASMGFGPFAAHFVSWFEFIAGILFIIGFLTKPVCVALAVEMAVIVWGTPAVPSIVYFGHDYNFFLLLTALSLYFIGPGKYSLAELWLSRKTG